MMFVRLLIVVEIGIFGGGILFCLVWVCCCDCIEVLFVILEGGLMLFFDEFFFYDMLSFWCREFIEDGVWGLLLVLGVGVGDFGVDFLEFCGWGLVGLWKF